MGGDLFTAELLKAAVLATGQLLPRDYRFKFAAAAANFGNRAAADAATSEASSPRKPVDALEDTTLNNAKAIAAALAGRGAPKLETATDSEPQPKPNDDDALVEPTDWEVNPNPAPIPPAAPMQPPPLRVEDFPTLDAYDAAVKERTAERKRRKWESMGRDPNEPAPLPASPARPAEPKTADAPRTDGIIGRNVDWTEGTGKHDTPEPVASTGPWWSNLAQRFDQWRNRNKQTDDKQQPDKQNAGIDEAQKTTQAAQQEQAADANANHWGPAGGYVDMAMKSVKPIATSLAFGTGLPKLLEVFAQRLSESNRNLTRFNGMIAASFAAKDIAQIRADWATAKGTEGTTSSLNLQLAKLIEETQPIRQSVVTILNLMGIAATRLARLYVSALKYLPFVEKAAETLAKMEETQRKEAAQSLPAQANRDALRDIRNGLFARGVNPPPGGPR